MFNPFKLFRRKIKLHGQVWLREHVDEPTEYCSQFDDWTHRAFEVEDAWGFRDKNGVVVAKGPKLDTASLEKALMDMADSSTFVAPDLAGGQWEEMADTWDHDHCEICWWTIQPEATDESSTAGWFSTKANAWVCEECYAKLLKRRLDAKHG